jgi:hypothetical protein
MQESNLVFATTSPEDPMCSELQRVGLRVILPEEPVEIPEITETDQHQELCFPMPTIG